MKGKKTICKIKPLLFISERSMELQNREKKIQLKNTGNNITNDHKHDNLPVNTKIITNTITIVSKKPPLELDDSL